METIFSLTEFTKRNSEEVEFSLQLALSGDDVPAEQAGKVTLTPRQIENLCAAAECDGGKLVQLRKYNDATAAPGLVGYYNADGQLAVATHSADFDLNNPDPEKFITTSIFSMPFQVLATAGWLIGQTVQNRATMNERAAYGKNKEEKKGPVSAMTANSLLAMFKPAAPAAAPAAEPAAATAPKPKK